MIVVAGGTGRLGRCLVTLLRTRGEDVRVVSRNPEAAVPPGCELATGDVRDPNAMRSAVAGATTVVSAVHGFTGGRGAGPDEIDDGGNRILIDAAAAAGARRFVLVSVVGARSDHPMPLHRAKFAAEQYLRATDLDWTIVRSSAFLETWLTVVSAGDLAGRRALVFGSARNPINFVSARDVAAVVDQVVADRRTVGQVVDVTGPDDLTLLDLAAALSAQQVRRVPRPALRLMAQVARPVSPAFARQARTGLVMDTMDMRAAGAADAASRRSVQDVLDELRREVPSSR